MAMKIIISILLLGLSTQLMALGLGSPKLKSVIGEPLNMEIPILGADRLTENELIFKLADQKDY